MKKLFSKELLIGLSMIITLLILIFGINYLKGINMFKASNYYYATYTNVEGLAQSAPVTINGFKVGLVREIEYQYDNPGHIRVEFSIDKELKVPKGSRAVLVTDMLGTATIDLQMASGSDCHDVGDELIAVNAPGLMQNITGEVLPAVTELMPKIDSLLTATTALVADPAIRSSVQRLDNIMANLETSTTQLTLVMRQLPPIASNASSTMGNVDQLSANLLTISNDLATLSAQLKEIPVDSITADLAGITANLNEITSSLNSDNSSLGLMMRDPSLYNNLNNSAAHVDSILVDLKRQPKRYIPSIKIF